MQYIIDAEIAWITLKPTSIEEVSCKIVSESTPITMHVFPQASDGLPESYPRDKYKFSIQEVAFLVNKLNILG